MYSMKLNMVFAEYLVLRSDEIPTQQAPVAERSITGGLFKVVNPARPVSPLNSRPLLFPGQKKFKSQVMGR
jgi:hypothetical protein